MSLRRIAVTIFTGAGLLALPVAVGCDGSRSAPGGAQPATTAAAAAAPVIHKEWGRAMARTPTPKAGCFKAKHPSTAWEEVPCIAPPSVPLVPAKGGAAGTPLQVGDGNGDQIATVPGVIGFAEGSFPNVVGVSDQGGLAGGGLMSGFSLQLNTNTQSNTPLCNQGPNPSGCTGWQQFAYIPGQLFIQYWLINYFTTAQSGNPCPSGYNYYDNGYYQGTTVVHEYDCWSNGSGSVGAPYYTAEQLGGIALAGSAGSTDQATLFFNNEVVTYTAPEGSVLNLNQWWQNAEFNVFGPGGGSAAVFNYGTTMSVQTVAITSPRTLNAPTCTGTSYTGEINNLNVVANSCCGVGGGEPAIFFTQSNVPGAAAFPCP